MKPPASFCRLMIAGLVMLSANVVCSAGGECFTQLDVHIGIGFGGEPLLHAVKLDGIAKGGELVLLEMLNPASRYIRIDTHAGESSEMVLAHMAAAINEVRPFNPGADRIKIRNKQGEIISGPPPKLAEGNLLKRFGGSPGQYIFAGTETGLGIPQPPMSLTAFYDSQTKEVSLQWENPDGGYDGTTINGGDHQPGNRSSATQISPPLAKRPKTPRANDREGLRADKGLHRFDVIGCRGGVLSNAGVITLNYQENSQEELDTQPFTAGIAPNWKSWSSGGEAGTLILEQGTKGEWKKFDQNPKSPLAPDDKPFYQLIKARSPNGVGGVCRKFLGLKPGHTYRLWTRMNTLEMEKANGDWTFSFHAAPHAKAVTLTSEQMAGTVSLPDGGSGRIAGQIAAYGPGSTTGGKFVERSTEKLELDSHMLDITLPPGADVITVWFRYTGPAASSGVGFDWIKLKDITPK